MWTIIFALFRRARIIYAFVPPPPRRYLSPESSRSRPVSGLSRLPLPRQETHRVPVLFAPIHLVFPRRPSGNHFHVNLPIISQSIGRTLLYFRIQYRLEKSPCPEGESAVFDRPSFHCGAPLLSPVKRGCSGLGTYGFMHRPARFCSFRTLRTSDDSSRHAVPEKKVKICVTFPRAVTELPGEMLHIFMA